MIDATTLWLLLGVVLGSILGAVIGHGTVGIILGVVLGAILSVLWRSKHPKKEKGKKNEITLQEPLYKERKSR